MANTKRRLEVDDVLIVDEKLVKQAIRGTTVGNFMEWYDFGIYAYLASKITPVFTGNADKELGLLLVLLGFAISFAVRPLGGMILGPLGDKIGRRKVLYFTMVMMSIVTAVIGLLPTYNMIGMWALVPLYLVRMTQGLSTGGEFAGASTYVSEFSPDKSRGYWSAWLNTASYIGFAGGALVVALTELLVGSQAMIDGLWRVPFFTAVPLGAVAIYLRTRMPETPAFDHDTKVAARDKQDPFARHGILGIIQHHWKAILIGFALVAAESAVGYALTSSLPTYLEEHLKLSGVQSSFSIVPVLVVMSLCLPFVGKLSDKYGRKTIYLAATISTLVLLYPAFILMNTGSFINVMIALFIVAIPAGLFVAMTASALPALFPTASRYGAMALTYNVAVSLFGGTMPMVIEWLVTNTKNNYMPVFYIMFFAAVALIATLCMRETAGRPLLGSVPTVTSRTEAQELVDTQDGNPLLDLQSMPLSHK